MGKIGMIVQGLNFVGRQGVIVHHNLIHHAIPVSTAAAPAAKSEELTAIVCRNLSWNSLDQGAIKIILMGQARRIPCNHDVLPLPCSQINLSIWPTRRSENILIGTHISLHDKISGTRVIIIKNIRISNLGGTRIHPQRNRKRLKIKPRP